jgi:hypothetical protein
MGGADRCTGDREALDDFTASTFSTWWLCWLTTASMALLGGRWGPSSSSSMMGCSRSTQRRLGASEAAEPSLAPKIAIAHLSQTGEKPDNPENSRSGIFVGKMVSGDGIEPPTQVFRRAGAPGRSAERAGSIADGRAGVRSCRHGRA